MATTTPVRPVPGAFLNTPAPAADPLRRDLFGAGAAGTTRRGPLGTSPPRQTAMNRLTTPAGRQPSPTPRPLPPAGPQAAPLVAAQPAADNTPPAQKAARFINDLLQLDGSFPDLDSYCRPGASSDYDLAVVDPAWAPFHKPAIYPMPDEVFHRFQGGQIHTKMGLFPEVHLAYVHIDNALYLWDYTSPEPELFGYEDSPHRITAVALVPPRPGVFVDTIKHMLVVATSTEVILLGLSQDNAGQAPRIFSTKMSVHKGGMDVSFIVGSADGRIFFGGTTDTDVHELYYQQEERWFSSRVGKINHTHPGWSSALPNPAAIIPYPSALWTPKTNEALADMVIDDSRKLLYTLSTKSTIRTYHMDGQNKLVKCIEKDKLSCLREITHMITRSQLLTDQMNIVSISPIHSNEASKLHLMALTDTGCRIFLSATNTASYMSSLSSNAAPQSMQVQFVKFPPRSESAAARQLGMDNGEVLDTNSTSLVTSRLGQRFAPGYFFDAVTKEDKLKDRIFVSAPESGRIRLAGATPGAPLRYHEHASWIEIGAARVLAIGLMTPPFAAAGQPMGFGNELAVQFDQAPPEFAIMTSEGIQILRRRRLVDIFATVIRKAPGEEGITEEVRRFIYLYGRQETISTALAVACGQGNDLRNGAPRVLDQVTQDRARSTFIDFGGQPTVGETDGQQISIDSVRLSYRYHALGSYLTRLIRRLWKAKVIVQGIDAASAVVVTSTISMAKLNSVQDSLDRLRNFLHANRGVIQGLSGPQDLSTVRNRHEEIAIQAEHQGLHALQRLMEGISEGISFVVMLFDERVSDIFVRLDPPTQDLLRNLTYEQLFSQTTGRDLAKILVKAIVNRNIESGANVETVAEALRRRCGSFCSPDDVVIFKAQEHLKRASEQVNNPNVLRQLLNDSLRLFERVAGNLTFANLEGAVQQYVGLQYYAGAIELCLKVAREKDRGNSALSWLNDNQPANDPREAAFAERQRCYDFIHEVLTHLDTVSTREAEMMDGRPTLFGTKLREAYDVVNGAGDEVFQYDLYEWYIARGFTERLLNVDSPHVVTFLQKLAATHREHAELLCRYYTMRRNFYAAAEVQYRLAESEEFDIGLEDRIKLLGQAKANASVATIGVSPQLQQVLNHAVATMLEIAHIQDDLLRRLLADSRIPDERKDEAEGILNGPIRSLNDLWNSYVSPAQYYDISLLVFHVADHHNPRAIADTWRNLIEAAHEEVEAQEQEWEAAGRPRDNPNVMEPPLPYEHVMAKVQDIAHRTSLNDHIFPIEFILTYLCRYSIEHGQDERIGANPAWPVLLFLNLHVPYPSITRVLERILDAQEAPFTGRRRKVVVGWIAEALLRWAREAETQGTAGGIGRWVEDLLHRCQEALEEIAHLDERSGKPHAADTQSLFAHVRELQGWVQETLGGRGTTGVRLF
ncbi:nucleoporin-domain-containing protein [Cryphonectria parasitica EP155]|uniref:Nucleoporin-domain-containing protein n=1 Tax=Cryphonectria parasitica (strain ATCC 38755 / EP155) TaxID=660469 RepID=A0A9P4Y5E9_CRYP1|nr:nucleoporin-domain-containing protein [Cryphonectria parasitica EP155]KAF3767257.1 nucleoporin-domain-containing protein [Cryphonectria parasitica EP155]